MGKIIELQRPSIGEILTFVTAGGMFSGKIAGYSGSDDNIAVDINEVYFRPAGNFSRLLAMDEAHIYLKNVVALIPCIERFQDQCP
jgi:hypothetical protein